MDGCRGVWDELVKCLLRLEALRFQKLCKSHSRHLCQPYSSFYFRCVDFVAPKPAKDINLRSCDWPELHGCCQLMELQRLHLINHLHSHHCQCEFSFLGESRTWRHNNENTIHDCLLCQKSFDQGSVLRNESSTQGKNRQSMTSCSSGWIEIQKGIVFWKK